MTLVATGAPAGEAPTTLPAAREVALLFCRPGRERLERKPDLLGGGEIHRIVAALDASPASLTVHRFAVALARSTEAALDLVVVVDAFSEIFFHRNGALIDDPDGYLRKTQAALEVAVQVTRFRGVSCSGRVLVGAPPLELARHAVASGADLVLLSTSITSALHLQRSLPWRRHLL
jgi:nucleotide-binding universal stress UspA family protein